MSNLAWTPVVKKAPVGWWYGVRSRGGFVGNDGWMPTKGLARFFATWVAVRQEMFDGGDPAANEGWEPASGHVASGHEPGEPSEWPDATLDWGTKGRA